MKRAVRRTVLAVALAALAGHVWWWYWPRLHRGAPRGVPAQWLAAPKFDDVVWIAYPHQNLARLESRAAGIDELAGHLAILLGGEPPAWPHFALWPVPPARALAWGRSTDGEVERVAITPYPWIGALLRAAGALAGNPWLAGGAVGQGEGAGRVRWQEGTWILERGTAALAGAPERRAGDPLAPPASRRPEAALAWVRVGDGHAPWPAGLYRLRALADGVELASGSVSASPAAPAVRVLGDRTVLIAVADRGAGAGAVALVRPRTTGTGLQLPGAVLVQRGDSGLRLPGARMLEAIGVEPHERAEGGFRIRSWDRGSLALGSELVASLPPADPSGEPPRLAVWADVDELAEWSEKLGAALRVVPFIDPEPARRWLAFAALARACGPGAALWVEIDGARGTARIALRHDAGAVD